MAELRITVKNDVHRRLKQRAAGMGVHGVHIKDLIPEIIEEWLNRKDQEEKKQSDGKGR